MHTDCVQVQRKKSRERFNPSEGDKKSPKNKHGKISKMQLD